MLCIFRAILAMAEVPCVSSLCCPLQQRLFSPYPSASPIAAAASSATRHRPLTLGTIKCEDDNDNGGGGELSCESPEIFNTAGDACITQSACETLGNNYYADSGANACSQCASGQIRNTAGNGCGPPPAIAFFLHPTTTNGDFGLTPIVAVACRKLCLTPAMTRACPIFTAPLTRILYLVYLPATATA